MRGPDKMQALAELRSRGVQIGSILDVGVMTDTPQLRSSFPDRHHVLFEPIREFYPAIEKNYADVPHTLVSAAVAEQEGEATLEVGTVLKGMAISYSNIVDGDADAPNRRRVPVVTLDGYLAEHTFAKPFFLKIDVDGREMSVMRGALETLASTSVVMVEAYVAEFAPRIAFLEQHGFELFDLVDLCYYDGSFSQCDAIFIRRELQRAHFAQPRPTFEADKYSAFRMKPPERS